MTVLPTMISNLKIFKDAFADGKSVVENKLSPAAEQMQSLIKDIKQIINHYKKGLINNGNNIQNII